STVHREVIDSMVACGGADHDHARRCFRRLAGLAGGAAAALGAGGPGVAGDAAAALGAGDLVAWAAALTAATATQADLHPGLVGAAHRRAIDVARAQGALGWKVNGAGGAGGSLTALAPDVAGAASLRAAWAAGDPGW